MTNVSSSSACESLDFSNSDWTTAYYMSRVDKIRAILDHGQPLPIGMLSSKNHTFASNQLEIHIFKVIQTNFIFLSKKK